jgi:hypothetical protein
MGIIRQSYRKKTKEAARDLEKRSNDVEVGGGNSDQSVGTSEIGDGDATGRVG